MNKRYNTRGFQETPYAKTYRQQPSFPRQQTLPQESNKKKWIFFGIIIGIMLALLFVFLFMKFFSSIISEDDLSKGTYVELKEDREIKFEMNEEQHRLVLDAFGEDYVDITLKSKPISATLKVGEFKKFDLNGDGIYDLIVKLKSIENKKPNIFIKRISERICTENWNCVDWSGCVNGAQTRVCTDLNSCGTTRNKPKEEQECGILLENESLNLEENEITNLLCSEQNGTICNQTEICNGTLMNASDSDRCCLGDCELEATINESEFCEDKGLYSIDEKRNGQCNSIQGYASGINETIWCCNYPPVYPVIFTDELRDIWSSIQDSGNCTVFNSKLSSCSQYKCSYIHPLTQENMKKGVLGEYYNKCHSFEEMPNNGELYCQYDNSQLIEMVNFYIFSEEQCGEGTCSIVLNSTGYFINGILTENVPQDMLDSGDCSATFG